MSWASINGIRNAFYSTLLELFAYYKEFVGSDPDGEATFDITRFCKISNKQYRYEYKMSFFIETFTTNSSLTILRKQIDFQISFS